MHTVPLIDHSRQAGASNLYIVTKLHFRVVMRAAGEPGEAAAAPPWRAALGVTVDVSGAAPLAADEPVRRRHHLHQAVLHRPGAAAPVEPGDDVGEDGVDVVVGLAGGEAVPHPRVELDGLVGAGGALVQRTAHLRVRHRVGLAVQDEERHAHLPPTTKNHNVQKLTLYICSEFSHWHSTELMHQFMADDNLVRWISQGFFSPVTSFARR